MFHQFTYIVAEEKLLDKVGLLEDGAEDDIKGGEAAISKYFFICFIFYICLYLFDGAKVQNYFHFFIPAPRRASASCDLETQLLVGAGAAALAVGGRCERY